RSALPLCMHGLKEVFIAVVVGVWIEMECGNAEGEIGGKAVIVAAGLEAEEIEIPLQRQLEDIRIEAEVAATLEFIGVVHVGISQLHEAEVRSCTYIIIEIF